MRFKIEFRKLFLKIILTIGLQVLFISIFSIILIYHGPFISLRNSIVETAMNTNQQKYWAEWFLSDSEIKKIVDKSKPNLVNAVQNVNDINVSKNVNLNNTSNNVKIEDVKGDHFKGKLMIISDPSKITVGVGKDFGRSGNRLSEIVMFNNALGGVNAGGFLDDNFVQNGSTPSGIVIVNGKIKSQEKKLEKFNVIGFNNKNELIISNNMSLDDIKKNNLRCAVSFGPALILNGKSLVTSGGTILNPRTVIGQRKDGTVLIMVVDGRESDSVGVTYQTMANEMLKNGAYNAANLDGGSSTTMYWDGKVINNPCDILGERSIPTAFLIMR